MDMAKGGACFIARQCNGVEICKKAREPPRARHWASCPAWKGGTLPMCASPTVMCCWVRGSPMHITLRSLPAGAAEGGGWRWRWTVDVGRRWCRGIDVSVHLVPRCWCDGWPRPHATSRAPRPRGVMARTGRRSWRGGGRGGDKEGY